MDYFKQHKEGFILTFLFHVILLFILVRFGFFTPLPLPEEQGVLIDFGVTDMGMGEIEPAPAKVQTQSIPVLAQPTPPKRTIPVKADKEEVMTQDFEKSAAIEAGKKKEKEEDLKRKEQQELEQQIENERQIERRKIAEQRRNDSLKQVQEQSQINAINSRAKNVFGGTNGQGTTASSGQGTTYQPGNQGSTNGTAGANNYGVGDGNGNGGAGVSFNLKGRKSVSLPKPSYPGNDEGVVVVEVTVDKYGKITKAVPGVKGSTSLNAGLLNAAKNAALKTSFNEDKNAPAFQTGTITYHFVLD